MGKVIALLDSETGIGFRLAGIESRWVESLDAMKQSIESVMQERGIDVVILDELLFQRLSEPFKNKIEASTSPVFLPIATIKLLTGRAKPEEYVARLIRRAIGYQIKIRR
jgi:vacuolar-type H+-ATPase subunit F/Vma7